MGLIRSVFQKRNKDLSKISTNSNENHESRKKSVGGDSFDSDFNSFDNEFFHSNSSSGSKNNNNSNNTKKRDSDRIVEENKEDSEEWHEQWNKFNKNNKSNSSENFVGSSSRNSSHHKEKYPTDYDYHNDDFFKQNGKVNMEIKGILKRPQHQHHQNMQKEKQQHNQYAKNEQEEEKNSEQSVVESLLNLDDSWKSASKVSSPRNYYSDKDNTTVTTKSLASSILPPPANKSAFFGTPRYDWIDIETSAATRIQAVFRRYSVLTWYYQFDLGHTTAAIRAHVRSRKKRRIQRARAEAKRKTMNAAKSLAQFFACGDDASFNGDRDSKKDHRRNANDTAAPANVGTSMAYTLPVMSKIIPNHTATATTNLVTTSQSDSMGDNEDNFGCGTPLTNKTSDMSVVVEIINIFQCGRADVQDAAENTTVQMDYSNLMEKLKLEQYLKGMRSGDASLREKYKGKEKPMDFVVVEGFALD